MIQIEMTATAALEDGDLEALGIVLAPYAGAANYEYETGLLFISATVENMLQFVALDVQLTGLLRSKTLSMAYTYTVIVPAGA